MKKNKPPKPGYVPISEAARMLKVRYLKARDLMLTGKFGDSLQDESGMFWIERERVERYDQIRQGKLRSWP